MHAYKVLQVDLMYLTKTGDEDEKVISESQIGPGGSDVSKICSVDYIYGYCL